MHFRHILTDTVNIMSGKARIFKAFYVSNRFNMS